MALLIIVALLIALGLLAMRFGADSRDRTRSGEENFAALGLTWDSAPAAPRSTTTRPTSTAMRPASWPRPTSRPAFGVR